MKKLLALFIVLVIADAIIAAALYVQKVREANARTASQFARPAPGSAATQAAGVPITSSPAAEWAALQGEYLQTATAETKAPASWSIAVVQDGLPVAEQNGAYLLKRAPFTLRISVPRQVFDEQPFILYLNALDRDEMSQRVQPGAIENITCEGNAAGCFAFSGFAEPNQSTGALALDLVDGVGTHLLYYRDMQDNRWDRVEIGDTEVILERNVVTITSIAGENVTQEIPVEQYSGGNLYLVFLLNYRAGPVVTEDELKKAVLQFE